MGNNAKPTGYWLGLIYAVLTLSASVVGSILKLLGEIPYGWGLIWSPVWGSLACAFVILLIAALLVISQGDKLKDI